MTNPIYPVSSDMEYVSDIRYRPKKEDAGPARDLYSSKMPVGTKV